MTMMFVHANLIADCVFLKTIAYTSNRSQITSFILVVGSIVVVVGMAVEVEHGPTYNITISLLLQRALLYLQLQE